MGALEVDTVCVPSAPVPPAAPLGIVTHSGLVRGKLRHKTWGQSWSL